MERDTHLLCSFVCEQCELHGQAPERLLEGAPRAEVQSSPGWQRCGVGAQSTAGTEHTLTYLPLPWMCVPRRVRTPGRGLRVLEGLVGMFGSR